MTPFLGVRGERSKDPCSLVPCLRASIAGEEGLGALVSAMFL